MPVKTSWALTRMINKRISTSFAYRLAKMASRKTRIEWLDSKKIKEQAVPHLPKASKGKRSADFLLAAAVATPQNEKSNP